MARKRSKSSKPSGPEAALLALLESGDAKARKELLELYRFVRDHPEFRKRAIAAMDPDEVKQIQDLWQGVKALVQHRRKGAPNKTLDGTQ